ncbi:SctD/MshK family protein [Halodesulfovibrio marinisediminis]|uniref:Type III secretion apparatus protein, YscD/HrpQ family n=1 Tax=Halodesulfovibrio marinisediminis DSM 17456 TaxID=1121457 RepID=A0A1N6I935_9BACT|nr:hypothetical protein [Halodesulfovibrio marinisediminis]SIO28548.1 type III secretion apparatus protein, YscD/HrpQ family [Halodesulfovibrio marinisediminis DSM 17456]
MTTNSTVTLSVLSGSAIGAEVALKEGSKNSFGSGENCDFIFFDSTIALKHAAVEVMEQDTLILYPLDASVHYYDEQGAEICCSEGATPPLDAGTLFRIGGLYFACLAQGASNDLISRITSSAFRMKSEALVEDPDVALSDPVKDLRADLGEQGADQESGDKGKRTGRFKKFCLLVIVMSLLCGLSVGVKSVVQTPDNAPQLQAAIEHLKGLTVKPPYESIEVSQTENGIIVISGEVLTFANLDALRAQVSLYPFSALFRVRVLEQRIEAMQLTASQLGYSVHFTFEDGAVVARGYIRSKDDLLDLQQVLADSFRMQPVAWHVVTANDVGKALRKILAGHEKVGRLSPTYNKERVIISGYLPDSAREWVHGVPFAINKALHVAIPLELQVEFKKPPEKKHKPVVKKPSLITKQSIKQIGVGSMPFVRLKNDQVFFLGGKTSDGSVITSISAKEIVLTKDGKHTTIVTE